MLNPSERDNLFNLFWNPLICLVLDYNSWLTPRKNKHACILVPIDVFIYPIFLYQMLLLIQRPKRCKSIIIPVETIVVDPQLLTLKRQVTQLFFELVFRIASFP